MAQYQLRFDGSRVVFPRMPDSDADLNFSTWIDAEPTLNRFCRAARQGRRRGETVDVEVALVHRPDNDYNPNAISVAMPAATGGDRDARHMGYLFDDDLREIGMPLLGDVAKRAETMADRTVELVCTGKVWGPGELSLYLPDGKVLREALLEFLGPEHPVEGSRRVQRPRNHRPTPTPPHADRVHSTRVPETAEALAWLASFKTDRRPVENIELALRLPLHGEPRRLRVTDSSSGREVGMIVSGYLILEDERDRADVLPLVAAAGLDVAQPAAFAASDWPEEQIPNMWTYWFPEGFDLRPRNPNGTRECPTPAIFNPTTRVLWVEDSRLVGPIRTYAARIGLPVEAVGLPRASWGLDDEVPYHDLKDQALRAARRHAWNPDDRHGPPPESLETNAEFVRNERFVAERARLFGLLRLTSKVGRCRLCPRDGLQFLASIGRKPLTYCHAHLHDAARGIGQDRKQAVEALRKLGQVEFDDVPMLEAQLDTLHVNPAAPVAGTVIDELLQLRAAIPRRKFAWTLMLEEAGLAPDGLRTSRGTLIRARDGHLCLSLREKAVCEFLHQHGIDHDREPLYPTDPVYNPNGRRRADWILRDGTFVELWGMPNDPAYAAKMVEKRALAARHGLMLVELTDAELPRLPEIFVRWLPDGAISGWSWTPVAARSAQPTEPRSRGDAFGRNDHNTAIRLERLERCREAVELQEAGLSRREIGLRLKVSEEQVKQLLRDGKFFADPAGDPQRLETAQRAALARELGQTRAQFQADLSLSKAKAEGAWRDADVVVPTGDRGTPAAGHR